MMPRSTLAALASWALIATAAADTRPVRTQETISYEGAKAVFSACEAMAVQNNWSVAIWVLDANAAPVLFASINGASETGVRTARLKAETALQLKMPSEDWQAFLDSPGRQLTSTVLGLFTSPGGLPLMHDGKVIGAVGVGGLPPSKGLSLDKQCAQAGMDALSRQLAR